MALFDGLGALGRGLGSAALGYGQGQIRGEAEGYRRGYNEDLLAARKAAARGASRKTPGDSLEAKTAAQIYETFSAKGIDPEFRQHLRDHPELAKQFRDGMNELPFVMRGERRLDSKTLAFFQGLDAPAGGPAPEPEAPAGVPFAGGVFGPRLATERLPVNGLGLAASFGLQPGEALIDRPQPGPPPPSPLEALARVQSGGPASLYEPLAGMGGMPQKPVSAGPPVTGAGARLNLPPDWRQQMMAPPVTAPTAAPITVPPPTTGPPAPAPNFDPQSEYMRLYQEGPPSERLVKGEEESQKAFDARKEKADKPYNQRLLRLQGALTAIPRSEILGARAAREPEVIEANLGRTGAQTGLAKEQTRASQVITPVRVAKGKQDVAASKERVKQGWARIAVSEDQVRVAQRNATSAERNATTNELRLAAQKDHWKSLQKQIDFNIDKFPDTQYWQNKRAELAYHGRILSAQQGIGPIRGSAAGSEAVGSSLAAQKILQEFKGQKQPPAKTAPGIRSGRTTTSNTSGGTTRNRAYWERAAKAARLSPEDTKAYLKSKGF